MLTLWRRGVCVRREGDRKWCGASPVGNLASHWWDATQVWPQPRPPTAPFHVCYLGAAYTLLLDQVSVIWVLEAPYCCTRWVSPGCWWHLNVAPGGLPGYWRHLTAGPRVSPGCWRHLTAGPGESRLPNVRLEVILEKKKEKNLWQWKWATTMKVINDCKGDFRQDCLWRWMWAEPVKVTWMNLSSASESEL